MQLKSFAEANYKIVKKIISGQESWKLLIGKILTLQTMNNILNTYYICIALHGNGGQTIIWIKSKRFCSKKMRFSVIHAPIQF